MENKRPIMEMEIDDPAFALLKVQINNALKDVLGKMVETETEDGKITISITLGTEEVVVPYREDYVNQLKVNWKVARQITLKDSTDGNVWGSENYYLEFDEHGKPYMKRIQQAQHEIDEYL